MKCLFWQMWFLKTYRAHSSKTWTYDLFWCLRRNVPLATARATVHVQNCNDGFQLCSWFMSGVLCCFLFFIQTYANNVKSYRTCLLANDLREFLVITYKSNPVLIFSILIMFLCECLYFDVCKSTIVALTSWLTYSYDKLFIHANCMYVCMFNV